VAEVLGVSTVIEALNAVESGDTAEELCGVGGGTYF
jgi:D-tyrosyl-tRNA(Tyr) deacylase